MHKSNKMDQQVQQRKDYHVYRDEENGHVRSTQRIRYGSISPRSNLVESREWDPESGTMSRGRRTFCLLTAFDLIFTFVLWVLYTQLIGGDNAFYNQVAFYQFEKSLFDTVMIAACRFTFIMLAYALFRIRHWWVIAITTSMTCIYILVKCFLFHFNDNVLGGKNPLSYILIIVCILMAWLEMWMLDFKVIPSEKRMIRESRVRSHQGDGDHLYSNHNTNHNTGTSIEDTREYYSPFHTPDGSEDEGEHEAHSHHGHHHKHKTHSRKECENYSQLLGEAREAFFEIFHMDGWKQETGKNLQEGIVYSQNIKKFGRKIFKVIGIIDLPPHDLWDDMIHTLNDSPKWNPTILESRSLQDIDDNTQITYNIAAEAAGGLVSARDFINIRRWDKLDHGVYISYAVGCSHIDMPVQKKYVRGENGPGGWVFEPVEGEPNKCLFTWMVNSNLKGWLPQSAIDQAMSYVLSSYFKLLVKHYNEIIEQRKESTS